MSLKQKTVSGLLWSFIDQFANLGVSFLTGIILAISRAAGETAPLLLIGAFSYVRFLPKNIMDAFTVMPIQIYVWAGKPQADFREVTSAAILVLMVILLMINALAIFLRNKYEKKTDSD